MNRAARSRAQVTCLYCAWCPTCRRAPSILLLRPGQQQGHHRLPGPGTFPANHFAIRPLPVRRWVVLCVWTDKVRHRCDWRGRRALIGGRHEHVDRPPPPPPPSGASHYTEEVRDTCFARTRLGSRRDEPSAGRRPRWPTACQGLGAAQSQLPGQPREEPLRWQTALEELAYVVYGVHASRVVLERRRGRVLEELASAERVSGGDDKVGGRLASRRWRDVAPAVSNLRRVAVVAAGRSRRFAWNLANDRQSWHTLLDSSFKVVNGALCDNKCKVQRHGRDAAASNVTKKALAELANKLQDNKSGCPRKI